MIRVGLFSHTDGAEREEGNRVHRFVCGTHQRLGLPVPSVRYSHFRGSRRHCGGSIVVRKELRVRGKVPLGENGEDSVTRSATLITRALALGQITPSDWWRALRHELLVGLALGITLGAIGFVRASLTPASVLGNADRWMLALVIGQSVAAICVWGTLVGSCCPCSSSELALIPAMRQVRLSPPSWT